MENRLVSKFQKAQNLRIGSGKEDYLTHEGTVKFSKSDRYLFNKIHINRCALSYGYSFKDFTIQAYAFYAGRGKKNKICSIYVYKDDYLLIWLYGIMNKDNSFSIKTYPVKFKKINGEDLVNEVLNHLLKLKPLQPICTTCAHNVQRKVVGVNNCNDKEYEDNQPLRHISNPTKVKGVYKLYKGEIYKNGNDKTLFSKMKRHKCALIYGANDDYKFEFGSMAGLDYERCDVLIDKGLIMLSLIQDSDVLTIEYYGKDLPTLIKEAGIIKLQKYLNRVLDKIHTLCKPSPCLKYLHKEEFDCVHFSGYEITGVCDNSYERIIGDGLSTDDTESNL